MKITKTNYTAVGESIFLQRDDEGRLLRAEIDNQKASLDEEQIELLVTTIREQGSQKRYYSKSSFAAAYGGRSGIFRLGQSALKGLIDRVLLARRLEVVPGKAQVLRFIEPIAKAKIDVGRKLVDD